MNALWSSRVIFINKLIIFLLFFLCWKFFLGIAQFVDAQAKAKSEKKDMLDTRALAGLGGLIGDKKKQVSTQCVAYLNARVFFLLETVVIHTIQSFEPDFYWDGDRS